LKRILIFYSHFSPAFKAGGPVQSLANMVNELNGCFEFYIFCGAREIGETSLLPGIKPDEWNAYTSNVQVYYASNGVARKVTSAIKKTNPDFIYVNGIFQPLYNSLPLWVARNYNKKVIIAPRGMLQEGALKIKPLKKKVFLSLLKTAGLFKGVIWHATDNQEAADIKKIAGSKTTVRLATNVSKRYGDSITPIKKLSGNLKLIYLSLIAEKKNLHLVLEALLLLKTPIEFDIYGPIKDEPYWVRCQRLLNGQIHSIRYRGVVSPENVQVILSGYHAFILPTKGENFGHAIYESLSVGVPVLVSQHTPWGDVRESTAGITINTFSAKDWADEIQEFVNLNQEEYSMFSNGAHGLAKRYFSINDFKAQYQSLFSDHLPT